jgi:hypothetical protein
MTIPWAWNSTERCSTGVGQTVTEARRRRGLVLVEQRRHGHIRERERVDEFILAQ